MRTIILSIIALFLLVSCTNSENSSGIKKTIITGKVTNLTEGSEHDYIEMIYMDLLAGQTKMMENLDETGNFRFEPKINYPGEFYLMYNGLLTFYISPGDSIHFNIDGNCWNSNTKSRTEKYKFFEVNGTSERMNKEVAKFYGFFLDSINNWKLQDSILKKSTPLEYKEFIIQQTKERFKSISEFNHKNNTSKQFKDWVQLNMKFTEWDDLMRFRWLHPMYNRIDRNEFSASLPKEYFDFLDDWNKEDKTNFSNKAYLDFLNEYNVYISQSIPEDTLKVMQALVKENFEKSVEFYINYCAGIESGLMKDVLISKYYYNLLDAKYYEKLKNILTPEIIKDELLRNQIIQKFEFEKQLFENPEYADGSVFNEIKDDNNYLQSLIKKYPKKVLYIDFWAPWCAPCMGEVPHAKKIKKEFEGKNVVFIYLANRCEEAAWKSTIAEKKMEGEHYLLTEKQYAKLISLLGITGIPHYTLIDKNGNIVSQRAPRPSSGADLIDQINKYLND